LFRGLSLEGELGRSRGLFELADEEGPDADRLRSIDKLCIFKIRPPCEEFFQNQIEVVPAVSKDSLGLLGSSDINAEADAIDDDELDCMAESLSDRLLGLLHELNDIEYVSDRHGLAMQCEVLLGQHEGHVADHVEDAECYLGW